MLAIDNGATSRRPSVSAGPLSRHAIPLANQTLLVRSTVNQSHKPHQQSTEVDSVPVQQRSASVLDQDKASIAMAAVFLWRRNGSELDLEGKLSQEMEVGYKWSPPPPFTQAHLSASCYPSSPHCRNLPVAKGNCTDKETVRTRTIQVQSMPEQSVDKVATGRRDSRKGDLKNSIYFNDGKRRVDFVLVYEQGVRVKPVDSSRVGRSFVEKEKLRQFFQENLHKDGLEMEEDVHKEENNAQITVFVKVHGTWSALCRQAELLKMKAPLRLRDTFAKQTEEAAPSKFRKYQNKAMSLLSQLMGFEPDTSDQSHAANKPIGEGSVVTWAFQRKKLDKYAIHNHDTFFTPTQRMEMVWEIMQKARNDPSDEKKRGIEQLLELGVYDAAFPLHDGLAGGTKRLPESEWCDRQWLRRTWATWGCTFKQQPLGLIRRYYGEKIGFYFAFLGFYTQMLAFPALVGLCTFLYGLIYGADDILVRDICNDELAPGNYPMCPICKPPNCEVTKLSEACTNAKWDYRMDNEATLAMACLTVIWATVFLKMWKRREAELSYEWDTYEMEQSDGVMRPEYEQRAPARRHNPVTRELEPYVPASRRAAWMAASILTTLLMLAAVGVALTCLVLARIALYGCFKNAGIHSSVEWARWCVHGLIFVVVLIFDTIYIWVGRKTTSLECPRTQPQWLSSFLWKVFIFELLNDFVPIAYAAWVKGKSISTPLHLTWKSELCDSGGCMGEVTELIAVLLLSRLVVGNATEIGLPFLKRFFCKFCCHTKSFSAYSSASLHTRSTNDDPEDDGCRQWRRDQMLGELELDGVADEYMEMIVQFAFVTLFVPAFPIAPFVCLLNNIVEIRVDAINFVISHRRPLPIRAPGIQIWNSFLDIIAKVAILCNAGLIAFTSEMIPRLYYKYSFNNGTSYDGFTEFSLSKIPTVAWRNHNHTEAYEEFTARNISECYYQDYRTEDETSHFSVTQHWWEIMCIRLTAFSMFVVTAFTFQWLYSFIVPDIPARVMLKIQRRRYVVAKAMEAEMAYDKWLKNTLHGKLPTCVSPAGSADTSAPSPGPADPHRPATAASSPLPNGEVDESRRSSIHPMPRYLSVQNGYAMRSALGTGHRLGSITPSRYERSGDSGWDKAKAVTRALS